MMPEGNKPSTPKENSTERLKRFKTMSEQFNKTAKLQRIKRSRSKDSSGSRPVKPPSLLHPPTRSVPYSGKSLSKKE
jgi:hypothetical protein